MTLEIIDELNKTLGVNKSIAPQIQDLYPRRRYYNTAFEDADGAIELAKDSFHEPEFTDLDFLPLEDDVAETNEDQMDVENDQFKLDKSELSIRERNLMENNKKYAKLIEERPNDVTVWVDYCKIQDSLFQFSTSKMNNSVIYLS